MLHHYCLPSFYSDIFIRNMWPGPNGSPAASGGFSTSDHKSSARVRRISLGGSLPSSLPRDALLSAAKTSHWGQGPQGSAKMGGVQGWRRMRAGRDEHAVFTFSSLADCWKTLWDHGLESVSALILAVWVCYRDQSSSSADRHNGRFLFLMQSWSLL